MMFAKYTSEPLKGILKDGHTMFTSDIVKDLQRKSFLEEHKEKLEIAISCFCREELGNMNFENDKEAIDYILSFHE